MLKYYFWCFQLISTLLECSSRSYYSKNLHLICNPTYQSNDYNKISLTTWEQSVKFRRRIGELKSRRFWSNCTITVEAKDMEGIYLNIIEMDLRQERHSKINENCIDYLLIKYNYEKVEKFCGHLDDNGLISLEDYSGKVEITISIDRNIAFGYGFSGEMLFSEFEFVATAYEKCKDDNQDEIVCKKNDTNSCIHRNFFGDRILNCLGPECLDEKLKNNLGNNKSSKIFSFIILVIVSVIIIIVTIYICCAFIYHILCVNLVKSHETPIREEPRISPLRQNSLKITQKPVEVPKISTADLDLPPSYDDYIASLKIIDNDIGVV